jgi:hypothetical protein
VEFQFGDAAVGQVAGGHWGAGAEGGNGRADDGAVSDDEDAAAGRVPERAGHRGGQPGGHLLVVLSAGKGSVVSSGTPVGEDLVVDGPRFLITAAVEVADVKLTEPFKDGHVAAGAGCDDLGGLGGAPQRGGVDDGGAGLAGQLPGERGGLGHTEFGERVVDDLVRELTGLVGGVVAVADVPGRNSSHPAVPACRKRRMSAAHSLGARLVSTRR